MKKILIAVVAVAGIAGLIAVINYKPSANNTTQTTTGSTTGGATTPTTAGSYKDGTYAGSAEQNEYGPVQVSVTVSGGNISNITMLQVPSDHQRSEEISAFSTPVLIKEAISAQSANVDIVSGATQTSESFISSLQAALDQAKS